MDGLAREMVHRLKYNNLRALVPVMGEYMANCIKNESWQIDMTVPVPLHRKRERSRGYNQSRLLAEEVAKRLSLPAEAGGLIRLVDTPPQAKTASLAIRRNNVRDAFQAVKSFEGKCVLMVDDVCTTCSTMEACAEALLKAGASSVFGLAFARQPMKDEITVLQ
jgi:ComF family protein